MFTDKALAKRPWCLQMYENHVLYCCATGHFSFMFPHSSVEGFGLEAEARMTTWHVAVPSENESDSVQSQDVSEGCYFSLFLTFLHFSNVCWIKA